MRHGEKNPEIRHEADLPLFAEQSFTKFEQTRAALLGTGESTETKDSSPQSRESAKPKARILPRQSPREQARARRDDPATSHAASRSVVNLGRTRDAILDILRKHGPMTDETIARIYNVRQANGNASIPRRSPSGLRSRRKELCDMGFMEDSGKLGKTAAKRDCTIWRLSPMGEQK